MEMDPAGQQVTDTGTAGVIARPPLLFLGALLIGFVLDRLLRLPFPVPGIDLVHGIIGCPQVRRERPWPPGRCREGCG